MRENGKADTLRKVDDLMSSVIESPWQTALALGLLAATALTSPVMAIVAAAAGTGLLWRRPRPAVGLLGGDALPGMRKPHFEEWQTYLIGHHAETGEPLRVTSDTARQHFLVLGAPGGGRSEVMTGMSEASVARGSGVMHVDGKGDYRPALRLRELATKHGRKDDYLFLDLRIPAEAGETLTLSLFSTMAHDPLTQVLVGLMPGGRGDEQMWRGRATAWLTALLGCLCWARSEGVPLDARRILDNADLDALHRMAAGEGEWERLPAPRRQSVASYLSSLFGYQEERGPRQAQSVREQHGYLEMTFQVLLRPIAEDYAHVFPATGGAVDISDVVLGRRLLAVTLAAPGDADPVVGKLVVACIKAMMGLAIGQGVKDRNGVHSWDSLFDMTFYPHYFLCILDDIGDYMVEGLALMAAQARSVGFSMVYGGDDFASLKAGNEIEASSVMSNTNSKIMLTSQVFDGHDGERTSQVGTLLYKAERIPFASHVPANVRSWRDGTQFRGFVPVSTAS